MVGENLEIVEFDVFPDCLDSKGARSLRNASEKLPQLRGYWNRLGYATALPCHFGVGVGVGVGISLGRFHQSSASTQNP